MLYLNGEPLPENRENAIKITNDLNAEMEEKIDAYNWMSENLCPECGEEECLCFLNSSVNA